MALPGDWDTVPVRYHSVLLDGNQPTGKLVITVVWERVTDDDATDPIWIIGAPLEIDLEASGPTDFELPATDDPDIDLSGWQYQAKEVFDSGPGQTFVFQVPMASLPGGINLVRDAVLGDDPTAGALIDGAAALLRYIPEISGVYAARPPSTGPILYIGPDSPPGGGTTAGGAGAVDDLDLWLQTT